MGVARTAIGHRIKRLREGLGLSRQQIAAHLEVDLTAVAAWEGGRYLPREGRRVQLAALLNIDVASLFAEEQAPAPANGAVLVDTLSELPGLLRQLLETTQTSLKALRLAAPYTTPPHVQEEFRGIVDRRLQDGTLQIDRIEIFYDLSRLKEVVSNILRYEGRPYRVKSSCAGVSEVVPGMGGYFFDDQEFLIGAYWSRVPPHARPGLRLSGEPFRTYFVDYWDEIWERGSALNPDGKPDVSAVRDVALKLGLEADAWPQFMAEAEAFEVGDGLPPLI